MTATAQDSLEYYAGLAVQGQQEGGFWGGAKQVGGWTGGLLSSLATKDNLDKTAQTLAFLLGGEVLTGIKWVNSLFCNPWLKSALAANGVAQGGEQIGQAWSGVGENGRQLSTPERVVAGISGVATIATTFLGFKGTNCFVAGTEIQTSDGTKNIEDLHVGDWVLSDDPNTPGDIEYKQVLQTFAHDSTKFVDIYIGGEKITTTEEHPFWVPDVGWVSAKDLHAGTHLQTKYESWLDVDRVELHGGLATVYNFEVAGFHTYFVSDLGLLVHNDCTVDVPKGYSYREVNGKGQIVRTDVTNQKPIKITDDGYLYSPVSFGSGRGRAGNATTRTQNDDLERKLVSRGYAVEREAYIPGAGGGTKGSVYVDLKATKDKKVVYVQTVDTKANGTPTVRELDNAQRGRDLLRAEGENPHFLLVPKSKY